MKRHGIFLAVIGSFLAIAPVWAGNHLEEATLAVTEAIASGNVWDGPIGGPPCRGAKRSSLLRRI